MDIVVSMMSLRFLVVRYSAAPVGYVELTKWWLGTKDYFLYLNIWSDICQRKNILAPCTIMTWITTLFLRRTSSSRLILMMNLCSLAANRPYFTDIGSYHHGKAPLNNPHILHLKHKNESYCAFLQLFCWETFSKKRLSYTTSFVIHDHHTPFNTNDTS